MTFPVTASVLPEHHRRVEALLDAGHEIAAHGDVHRAFRGPTETQTDRLQAMQEAFERHLGFRPRGFRAPYLDHDPNTYGALAAQGLDYDSSRVCKDPMTYLAAMIGSAHAFPIPARELPLLVGRYIVGRTAARPYLAAPGVVELPVFDLDDWFFYDFQGGPRLPPERSSEMARQWLSALDHFRQQGGTLFNVQAHPRRIARGLLPAIEELIEGAKARGGEFLSLSDLRDRLWNDRKWRARNVEPPRWLKARPVPPSGHA